METIKEEEEEEEEEEGEEQGKIILDKEDLWLWSGSNLRNSLITFP
jgi:hypothetical protein